MKIKDEYFVMCECSGHLISINTDIDDKFPDIFLELWYRAGLEDKSFLCRIKKAIKIILGRDIFLYDVILSRKEAKKLGKLLINISEK